MNRDARLKLEDLLLSCIQCGLCLPVCATYLAGGDEAWSPRGRLLLLGDALRDGVTEPEESIARAWDHCLGCRACEAVCPSGTPYELLEYARDLAVDQSTAARRRLAGVLTNRTVAGAIKQVGRLAAKTPFSHKLVDTIPDAPSDSKLIVQLDELSGLDSWPRGVPTAASIKGHVVLLSGCANATFLSDSQQRLLQVLGGAGIEVDLPRGQECCGAMPEHAYNKSAAARIRQRNTDRLSAPLTTADALLAEASGCSAYLQEYPPEIAEKSRHVLSYLADLDLPPMRSVSLRVAVHDPCHALHLLGLRDEPRALLRRIPGLELIQPREADVCCGSGGPYALFHADFSATMGKRKAQILTENHVDLIVTSNPGCQGQISAGLKAMGLEIPIIQLTDLLWYAMLK
jgi:glycolate dehydrogenase iron-sulfur subunit